MPPTPFGHYLLLDTIGRGAMGVVHRAFDTRAKRTVALKLLAVELAGNEEYRTRFQREAKLVARINHPHVIRIHEFGEIDGQLYLDMELIDGIDLASRIARNGPCPPTRALAITSQVAGALDAAHHEGLVHRDVKPSNILISGDPGAEFATLIDFGIARALDSTQLTHEGDLLGSVPYMAPERFHSAQPTETGTPDPTITPAMDVYSLGCVFHELLTGKKPFLGHNAQVMYQHLYEPPPRPSALRPGVPAGLDDVIARGMAKNPADRYGSAGELTATARAVVVPQPYRPDRRVPDDPGRKRRRRVVAAVVGVAVVVLLGAGAVAVATLPDPPCLTAGAAAPSGPLSVSANIPLAAPGDLAVAPDGCHAYIGTDQGTVSVVDTRSRTVTATVPVGNGPVTVTTAGDTGRAYVTDRATGLLSVVDTSTVTATIPLGAGITDIAATPDGRQVYAVTDRGDTVVFDVERKLRTATIPVGGTGAHSIGLTSDGLRAYVADDRAGVVSVIDTGAGAVIATVRVGNGPGSLVVSPDGDRVYVSNHTDGTMSVIDTTSNAVVATTRPVTQPGATVLLAVAPDRGRVYLAGGQLLSVIDTSTNTVVRSLDIPDGVTGLTLSPDGRNAYLTSTTANSLSVIATGVG